jgi:hypothetical protein
VHAVLLTWNPGPDDDYVWTPAAWDDSVVAPCSHGRPVATTWGVAHHFNGIEPGVDAFLYRQGLHGRGIIARGTIRSHPAPAPHWDPTHARRGASTKIVDIELQEAVPVEDALGVDQLEALIPEFAWRKVYSSGRLVAAPAAERLRRLWEWHAAGKG